MSRRSRSDGGLDQFLVLSTSAPFLIAEIAACRDLATKMWIKP
jgi:hypothetical protein